MKHLDLNRGIFEINIFFYKELQIREKCSTIMSFIKQICIRYCKSDWNLKMVTAGKIPAESQSNVNIQKHFSAHRNALHGFSLKRYK